MKKVKTLDVIGSDFNVEELFKVIDNNANIENLSLKCCNIVDNNFLKLILKKLPYLKKLELIEMNNITVVDLSECSYLNDLFIKSNMCLTNVYGLDKHKLNFFSFFDNRMYNNPAEIVEYAINNRNCEIDFLYFPSVINRMSNDKGIEDNVKSITFCESVDLHSNDYLKYSYYVMKDLYDKVLNLVNKYVDKKDSQLEKFAIIYQWLCENIKYDYDNYYKGKNLGLKNGENGMINVFLHKKAVCEGYIKAAQFFLSLCNMSSYNVGNLAGEKKEGHSILGLPIGNNFYYSDITFDACYYQAGECRKNFLLSKHDISKEHELLFEQNRICYNKSLSDEEMERLLSFAQKRIRDVDTKKIVINREENNMSIKEEIENNFGVNIDTMDAWEIDDLIRNVRRKILSKVIQSKFGYEAINFLEKRSSELFYKQNKEKVESKRTSIFDKIVNGDVPRKFDFPIETDYSKSDFDGLTIDQLESLKNEIKDEDFEPRSRRM